MQWDSSRDAGFSTAAKTWLPVPPSADQHNVAVEGRDPDSILNLYKHLIALRRKMPALRGGAYVAVNRDDESVLAYLRESVDGSPSVLVALNMTAEPRTVNFKLNGFGVPGNSLGVLLSSPGQRETVLPLKRVHLDPFGVLIATVN